MADSRVLRELNPLVASSAGTAIFLIPSSLEVTSITGEGQCTHIVSGLRALTFRPVRLDGDRCTTIAGDLITRRYPRRSLETRFPLAVLRQIQVFRFPLNG